MLYKVHSIRFYCACPITRERNPANYFPLVVKIMVLATRKAVVYLTPKPLRQTVQEVSLQVKEQFHNDKHKPLYHNTTVHCMITE